MLLAAQTLAENGRCCDYLSGVEESCCWFSGLPLLWKVVMMMRNVCCSWKWSRTYRSLFPFWRKPRMTSNGLTLNNRPVAILASTVRSTGHTKFTVSSSPPSHLSTLSVSYSSGTGVILISWLHWANQKHQYCPVQFHAKSYNFLAQSSGEFHVMVLSSWRHLCHGFSYQQGDHFLNFISNSNLTFLCSYVSDGYNHSLQGQPQSSPWESEDL